MGDDKVKDVVKDIDNEAEELDKEKEEKAAKEKEEKEEEEEDKDIKNPVDIDGSGTHDEKVEEDKDIKKQLLEPQASTGASESLDTTASTGTTDESGNDDKVKDVVKDINNEAEEKQKKMEEDKKVAER